MTSAKSETLKSLCSRLIEIFKGEEDTEVLEKAVELGELMDKEDRGKLLKKRKHSELLYPDKLKSIENLGYAIALTEYLSKQDNEESLQDLKDLVQIVESMTQKQAEGPDPLDVLFDLLVSQLTKQSGNVG